MFCLIFISAHQDFIPLAIEMPLAALLPYLHAKPG